jgi:uncharacterized membrane protein YccC
MTAAQPTISGSGAVSLQERLRVATPAILFGLRMWASVCLALWVAFELELSEPSWAATTAAIVCTPALGASLRKASFRLIGTVLGAIGIVILAALFRQSREGFLVGLALWCAGCAFVAALLTNFAAYAAALAGYTAAILASDILGPVGASSSSDVTILAINRALEICIGIVCAGVVLALTDLGHSRRKLATEFAALSTEIMNGFADCFLTASSSLDQFQALRRDLLRRVIALDPMIDAALGEASDLRYRSRVLQQAVTGLMETISVWRKVAFAIEKNADGAMAGEADAVHRQLPRDRLSPDLTGAGRKPAELRRECCAAARSLVRFPAQTPRQQLLADSAATGMIGMSRALNGLTLVVDPHEALGVKGTARLHVPDWLPPSISALRIVLAVGAMSLFWIASAWPNGAVAITFCAIIVVLLPLQGDLAYSASLTFLRGCVFGAGVAAVLVFAILPRVTSFPSLCLALALPLVPLGFLLARAKNPLFYFAASVNFIPMLSITNGMTFDGSQFWNNTSAILFGIAVGAISILILPPVPPPIRARRLLALTLADLRRLARRAKPGRLEAWEGRGFARLLAMPDQAQPVQRAELVSMVAVGKEILRLRRAPPRFIASGALGAALGALAEGRSSRAIEGFERVDRELAALASPLAPSRIVMSLRASILVICGQLSEFPSCYNGEPTG